MKNLANKIQESILDNDTKVTKDAMKQAAREWMKWATKAYQNECKEGEDYTIDDEGHIHIFGDCTHIRLTSLHGTLKKLNQFVKVVELNPTSRCTVDITDAEVAMKVLPVSQWGGRSPHDDFDVIYRTKQNLQPKDFPMFIHGNIRIDEAGNINFSIMPDCSGEFKINTVKCGNIKWPAGFPSSAKEIKIQR